MRSYRRFAAAAMASALLFGGALAGCGGGGGGGGRSNVATSRAASFETVQSARSAIASLIAARSFGGSRSRRAHLLQVSRQQGSLDYDYEQGLYYSTSSSEDGRVIQLNYFTDESGVHSAGFIKIQVISDTNLTIQFDITAGEQPQEGSLTIASNDANGDSGRLTGTITDRLAGNRLTFDLNYNEAGDTTGTLTSVDGSDTVRFTNLVIGANESLESDVTFNNITGHISQYPDGSGTFTLNNPEGSGHYIASYNAAGAGTLTYPDGTVENINDYDTVGE